MAAVTVTRSQLSVARPPLPSDLTRRQASPSASAFRHPSSIPLIATSLRSQLGPNRARRECRARALELNRSPLDEDGEARNDTFLKNFLPRPLSSAYLSAWTPKEARLRVAYEGFKGAYSEAAALEAYPDCEPVPCAEFDTAFQAVEGWLVDRAILPIENSLNGSIHRNYDLLLRHKLHIVGEVNLDVQHCLLANHGVKVEDLNRVLSHPLAFDQCERTLKTLGFSERETRYDTAGAAKEIAELQLKDTGAVASSAAASIYNLNILEENVQDEGYNVTRFFMLARDPIIPRTDRPCKTSIVFTLPDEIGILVNALGFFALRNINLTKIESRPLLMQRSRASEYRSDGSPRRFDYLFYLDFEASMADEVAQNALRQLNEFATFVRVLGSYPADKR